MTSLLSSPGLSSHESEVEQGSTQATPGILNQHLDGNSAGIASSKSGHDESASDSSSRSNEEEAPDPSWFKAATILLSLKTSAEARMKGSQNSRTNASCPSWPQCNSPQDHMGNGHYHGNGCDEEDETTSRKRTRISYDNGFASNEDSFEEDDDDETGKDLSTTCSLCHKVYSRPSTLKAHMRIHTGEKPFHCSICDKSFSQDANLKAHLRVHSKEKPFKCQICQRRFAQSSSVTTHMRIHSGERPYKCKVCSRGFADSSTLTKHLRIHTGEKPYECKVCEMRFSQSGNLSRHMRVHGRKK